MAREQHAVLVSALRGLGVDVLELAPDEGSAESVYTQDLAVVVNGIALMCRPGPHRQAEVQLVDRNGIISKRSLKCSECSNAATFSFR